MNKLLSLFLLMPFAGLAAAQDEAAHAPSDTVSIVFVVLFLILFIGSIVGFFVYLWWIERQKKLE